MTIRNIPRHTAATVASRASEVATMPRDPRKSPSPAPEPADASIYATEEERRFLAEYKAFYTALRENDPVAWEEFLEEHREWDFTLMDGLEDE